MKRVAFFLLIALINSVGTFGSDAVYTLEKNFFLYADDHKTLLKVHERATLSIQVASTLGAAVQVEDRMSGVLASSGTPGRTDGRIDRTFDSGEYRITIKRGNNDRERLSLQIIPFTEKNTQIQTGALLSIADGEIYATDLGDLETRSFWIIADDPLYLEILGRNLANCSLWRDGLWLSDYRSMESTFAANEGKPKSHVEYAHQLDPGNYLLVCRGGPSKTWSEDGDDDSLIIRQGARYIGTNFSRTLTVSPFGRDAYFIGSGSGYHELRQQEKKRSRISVAQYNIGRSRFSGRNSSYIVPESEKNYVSLQARNSGTHQWLIVEGAPGTQVRLTSFVPSLTGSISASGLPGEFLISTLSSHGSIDSIDATGLLVQGDAILKSRDVRLGGDNPFVRRFNLDTSMAVMLQVEEDGTYRIFENEDNAAAATYGFLDMANRNQVEPYFGDEGQYRLNQGVYLLIINPERIGILNFAIVKEGLLSFSRAKARNLLSDTPPAIRDYVFWDEVQIPGGESAFFSMLERPGIMAGIDFRKLPIDPREPLAVTLESGQSANLSVYLDKPKMITVEGGAFALTEGQRRITAGEMLPTGRHELYLQNSGPDRTVFMIEAENRVEIAETPEVSRIEEILSLITEEQPIFADYGRNGRKNYLLEVDKPGFYLLETTGRLSTEVNVRTATVTSLFSRSRNGDGQNARVSAYLKKGQYLVEVRTLGRSAGRAGLILRKQILTDAGILKEGSIAREDINSDEILKFTLENADSGDYFFTSLSPDVRHPLRVEEFDGWLVGTGAGSIRMDMEEGTYQAFSLAFPHDGRRISTYSKIIPPDQPVDKFGRRLLSLNGSLEGVWRETPERTPQEYAFILPAESGINFRISGQVIARFFSENGNSPVLVLQENESKSITLNAGTYVIQIQAKEEDDKVSYVISASTDVLMEGVPQIRNRLPVVVEMSLELDGTYIIESFGGVDLEAELFDPESGEILAQSDDREADWNILLARKLKQGRYQLRCSKSGIGSGAITFTVTRREERSVSRAKTDFLKEIQASQDVVALPFTTDQTGLYLLELRGAGEFNIKLYRENEILAESDGRIIIPLHGGTEYRTEFFTSSKAREEMTIAVTALSTNDWDLSLSNGIVSKSPAIQAFYRAGGNFELNSTENRRLLFSTGIEVPALPAAAATVPVTSEGTWIVLEDLKPPIKIESKEEPLRAGRAAVFFSQGEPQYFTVSENDKQVTLLFAETPTGISGIELGTMDGRFNSTVDWNAMSVQQGLTVTGFGGEEDYRGRVWSAKGKKQIRIALSRETYPVTETVPLSQDTLALEPGKAVKINLFESGEFETRSFSILLARGTAAILQNRTGPYAVAYAAERNQEFLLPDKGGEMYLINILDRPSLARIEYRSATQIPVLSPRDSIEIVPSSMEKTPVFNIAKGGRWLAVLQDDALISGDLVLFGEDGKIYDGEPMGYGLPGVIFPPVGGLLQAANTSDYMRVWISFSDVPVADLLGSGVKSTASGISFPLPSRFPVLPQGYQTTPDTGTVWRLENAKGKFIRLSAAGPGMIWIHGPNGFERIAVSGGTDLELSAYLAGDQYSIYYRPFISADRKAAGVSVSMLQPEQLFENREKRYFIKPDEERVFIFEVASEGNIGVGISAEEEGPTGTLYDSNFKFLGEGPLLFRSLEPGEYLYIVRGVGKAVQYQPLIFGVEGSRRGIPEDIKEQYQGGAR